MATAPRSYTRLTRLLLAGIAGLAASGRLAAEPRPAEVGEARSWLESGYRRFGPPQTVLPGRAVLLDESDDPGLRAALAGELGRLFGELYEKQGWRVPFAEDEPLRIYVARQAAGGVRRIAARSVERGKLVAPSVLLDATGLTAAQIVREVSRQVARATLAGYDVAEDAFLTPAVAEALADSDATSDEEVWALAAAPMLDLGAQPATLGRFWIAEVVRETGGDFLRRVWEDAAATQEAPMALLRRRLAQADSEETALIRTAARLYTALEPESGPSRLRLFDLDSGALDAAAPAALSVRHRSLLPESLQETLDVQWPVDGGLGAAVVRYRDAALPPDVLFFHPGQRRTVPLSGVARIDWLVAGRVHGGSGLRAPVYCGRTSAPFAGLEPHASSEPGEPRLWWTTASHEGLWGWAVFREQVATDGRILRSGPELVPSSERAKESFGYVFVDSGAAPGTYYRYTVWAVTDEGLLDRAFAVTLKTPD